jgi:hypothetical protein
MSHLQESRYIHRRWNRLWEVSPREIKAERYENALLGCHIGVMKRILGGKSGNSGGKVNRALKKPPSLERKIRIREATKRVNTY